MNSQIELYQHNQIAYDKLCDMLSQSDRACVIQPTGTGKFVIIAKLVQDNPDKRFLLLGTNDYMFIDQMDNLEKIAPGFHPDNLQFKTYSAAMVHARSEHVTLQYDYIILDEFHHCGAPEWSKGVQWFIDGSPDAKLLGFSATPIRFSDDGRNMADEIFEGNIVSSMELEEAWLRGILPIPKYVIALYDAPKEFGELKVSIEKVKDKKKYSKFTKKYEELRRSLQDAGGVDTVIAKHLKKSDAKIIVFCPNNEKLQEFMALSHEWFHGVNENIHVYKTTSADPTAGTEDFQMFKDDDSGALKVLYCINQLNEAVHISGIDAIVMVRPTKSPVIFHQQLGRALSSGGNGTPLLGDEGPHEGETISPVLEELPAEGRHRLPITIAKIETYDGDQQRHQSRGRDLLVDFRVSLALSHKRPSFLTLASRQGAGERDGDGGSGGRRGALREALVAAEAEIVLGADAVGVAGARAVVALKCRRLPTHGDAVRADDALAARLYLVEQVPEVGGG